MTRESGYRPKRCLDTGLRDGPERRVGFAADRIVRRAGPAGQLHGADSRRLHGSEPAGRHLPVDFPLAGEPRPRPDRHLQRTQRPDDAGGLCGQRMGVARPGRRGLDPAGPVRQRLRLPPDPLPRQRHPRVGGGARPASGPGRGLLLVRVPPGELRHDLRRRPRPLLRCAGERDLAPYRRPAAGGGGRHRRRDPRRCTVPRL